MESVEGKIKTEYVVFTKVLKVEEGSARAYVSGHGDNAVFKEVKTGWFVTFKDSHESICLGYDSPDFKAGDEVEIIFRRI